MFTPRNGAPARPRGLHVPLGIGFEHGRQQFEFRRDVEQRSPRFEIVDRLSLGPHFGRVLATVVGVVMFALQLAYPSTRS
jgi:hypothetical protein